MKISARIDSGYNRQETVVQTNDSAKTVVLPVKPTGLGSAVNGGELLLLALATCFCNDIYREAGKRGISVTGVEVEFNGEFGGEGEPGSNFTYKAKVESSASAEEIKELILYTDRIAEVHNTLRKGLAVRLDETQP
ncbi:MAG: OsmC family protein [Bacteroidetes bacterium]|nr:OsmC family protein [Bacteroidota bacterium]